MTRSSIRRSVLALSLAGASALVASGCGQEEPVAAAPAGDPGAAAVAPKTAQVLFQADFCDDALSPSCTPTGAHGKIAVGFQPVHAGYACITCHYVGGRLAFEPNGPAFIKPVGPSNPRPFYDATAKTCTNIACHTVPAGTFSYFFPDGEGNPQPNTVPYGGGSPQPTPSWYSTGAGCSACHLSPPIYNGAPYPWHSGFHGNTLAQNDCQLCHLDAVSTYVAPPLPQTWPNNKGSWTNVGLSTATNCTVNGVPNRPCNVLHANGQLNVNATFRQQCFGCH